MLAEIRTDMVVQQKSDDQLHAEREAECEAEINEYVRRINVATIDRDDATSEIANLRSEIGRLNADIRNKQAQLSILDTRDVELRAARERDAADFENRQRQSVEVIGALELIIEKLSNIPAHEGNAEAALAELSRIGGNNPILALVQVASTFSQESLDKVIGKMEELRNSLEAAIEDDKVNEQAALGEYQVLLSEIESTRKKIQQGLADSESQLRQSESALAIQEKKLEDSVNELKAAFEGKVAKEGQCEEWRVKYESDKGKRSQEISVVQAVENIIATKLDTMKDYLKERADADQE